MPSSVRDYEEMTAFERLILDRVMPLIPLKEGPAHSVIDLRAGSNSISVAVHLHDAATAAATVGGSSRTLDPADILPLVFGAAWKIIDVIIELSLTIGRIPPKGFQHDYLITQKINAASNDQVPAVAPFGQKFQLWRRVMRSYAATEAVRHSLIHRELKVDAATGIMTPTSRTAVVATSRPALQPLTRLEAFAFCRSAQGAAAAVIAGDLSARQARQLSFLLDQLLQHHRLSALGGTEVAEIIPDVLANAEHESNDEVAVDFPHLLALAQRGVQGVSQYNLHLHLPDGRILTCELESAPRHRVTFSPDFPPPYLAPA